MFKEKDLPIRWLKQTEFLKRDRGIEYSNIHWRYLIKHEKGSNWFPEGESFNNSSHPYLEKNREVIEILAGKEKTEAVSGKGDPKGDANATKGELLPKNFAIKYGQLNVNLF